MTYLVEVEGRLQILVQANDGSCFLNNGNYFTKVDDKEATRLIKESK